MADRRNTLLPQSSLGGHRSGGAKEEEMDYRTNPLAPIPKVWVPAVPALFAVLVSWVASGDFGPAELGGLLTTLGYGVLGYVIPTEGVGTRGAAGARGARRPPGDERFGPPTSPM